MMTRRVGKPDASKDAGSSRSGAEAHPGGHSWDRRHLGGTAEANETLAFPGYLVHQLIKVQ